MGASNSRSCSLFFFEEKRDSPETSSSSSSVILNLPTDDSFEDALNSAKGKRKNPNNQNTPEFVEHALKSLPVSKLHPDLVERACQIVRKWHADFPFQVFRKVVKGDRVAKEFNESGPVIKSVVDFVNNEFETPENEDERITIIDLCSGFGYLAMFLAEILPSSKVKRIHCIDKEWPQFNERPKKNRLTNQHIVDLSAEESDNGKSWSPKYGKIEVSTRKVNLKEYSQVKSMDVHLWGETKWKKSPVIILGIHLCGTLSFKAVEMFNAHRNAIKLILKPCCLPNWTLVRAYAEHMDPQRDHFGPFGSKKFCVKTHDVCARGKWKKNKWIGPDRYTLKPKFETWTNALCDAVEEIGVDKEIRRIKVQETGGFQNLYIFAKRTELGDDAIETDWNRNLRVFSTWNGGEAHRWHPDGRGRGTHVKDIKASS